MLGNPENERRHAFKSYSQSGVLLTAYPRWLGVTANLAVLVYAAQFTRKEFPLADVVLYVAIANLACLWIGSTWPFARRHWKWSVAVLFLVPSVVIFREWRAVQARSVDPGGQSQTPFDPRSVGAELVPPPAGR